jgi:hypothetical protein
MALLDEELLLRVLLFASSYLTFIYSFEFPFLLRLDIGRWLVFLDGRHGEKAFRIDFSLAPHILQAAYAFLHT